MDSKKWTICSVAVIFVLLILIAAVIAVIDPYFHFRAPMEGIPYDFRGERYQNNGIVRHFDYDAVITGTSMTENFRTSEFDQLFQADTIKVPYAGGTFKESSDALRLAFSVHPELRYVLFSLDRGCLDAEKDQANYESYPNYLYDDDLYNDINYVLNKQSAYDLLPTLVNILRGGEMTDFDDYSSWRDIGGFGRQDVLEKYQRPEKGQTVAFTEADRAKVAGNLEQNIISLAEEHPGTDFYLFFPPYSILSWDELYRQGTLERYLDLERYTIERLLTCENIHLFSFSDDFALVTDLDQYRDSYHYNGDVNSWMLRCMKDGRHELTEDNYEEYCAKTREFYTQYDYDGLFAQDQSLGVTE